MALSCLGCLQQPVLAASYSTHQASLVVGFNLLTANGLVFELQTSHPLGTSLHSASGPAGRLRPREQPSLRSGGVKGEG